MAAPKKKTAGRTTGKKRSSAKSGSKKKKETMESFIPKEILVLTVFAVSVLLFLSNLHLCGSAGESIRSVILGVFGALGYLFPIYLFIAALFLISNKGNTLAMAKLFTTAFVFILLCGISQLLSTKEYDEILAAAEYYKAGSTGFNGGAVGGFLLRTLRPNFGILGSYVILIVLTLMGLVFITERSILKPIRSGSTKIYTTAKEDVVRRKAAYDERREEKREEKRRRMDQKISGVAIGNTKLKDSTQPKSDMKEMGSEESFQADIFTGSINFPLDDPEDEAGEKTDDILSDMNAALGMENGDAIVLEKDRRTLSELQAIDTLHSMIGKEEGRFSFPHAGADAEPAAVSALERQKYFPHEQEEERSYAPAFVTEEEADVHTQESPMEQERPVIRRKSAAALYDTKTVTTASGKVIEVEVKPEDLVAEVGEGSGFSESIESEYQAKGEYEPEPVRAKVPDKEPYVMPSAGGTFLAEQPVQPYQQPKPKIKREYVFPPIRLLNTSGKSGRAGNDRELRETAIKLQQTLRNFGVGVTVTNISCGPAVTRYELQPEQGVKVSKIVSLADDIKLNLAAADIRIEAPIPGKAAVGIEVPNKENVTVFFRELVESDVFKRHPSKLAFAVGRDIGGQIVVTDLAKMPHLLIAGATGSGKSVCINTLIMSIIYKAKPEEVKVIMVDPKVVELSVYNGIPHLMIPVVTDPKKAAGALNWAVAEMTDRYKKFADLNVRDLKGYNEKIKQNAKEGEEVQPLPQIVIIVDELADLMMVAPGEVEDAICRLAQMARAAGLHLVLATQRPSVNVITGLIKANVPSRIAFSVSSGVDSRTIIDMNGAEKLLGKGDMLFYPSGYQKPVRVQGAFISDGEVSKVVEFLSKQTDGVQYDVQVESQMNLSSLPGGENMAGNGPERDEYFVQAGKFIIEKEKASIGMLQRMFKIGFNRAARIMDQLSEAGVVGEEEGTKPRRVLMNMDEFDAYLQENS